MSEEVKETVEMPELSKSLEKLTMKKSDMIVAKLFSAQWIMSVGVTLGATILTILVVVKFKEYANVCLTVYFSNWGIIITNYFKRDSSKDTFVGSNGQK